MPGTTVNEQDLITVVDDVFICSLTVNARLHPVLLPDEEEGTVQAADQEASAQEEEKGPGGPQPGAEPSLPPFLPPPLL